MPLEAYYEPLDMEVLRRAMDEMAARHRQLAHERAARIRANAVGPMDLALGELGNLEHKKKNQ